MGNVYEMHGKERRSTQASMWIAKLDRGLTRAETGELRCWMAEDPQNQAKLTALAEMWDQMDAMARLSELLPHSGDEQPRKQKVWLAAAAAALVAVLAGLTAVYLVPDASKTVADRVAMNESGVYETAIGGILTVQLSDGSQIVLNTNSRVAVEFTATERAIQLHRGEFHIDVAHDTSRPLRVFVGRRVVQAVGTAFTIRIDDDNRIELLVVDGKVRVSVAPSSLEAAAIISDDGELYTRGQRVVLDAASETLDTLEPKEIEVQLSWRNGNLIFDGESLGEAISKISRYTTVEFVFVDEDLQKVRVAGLFKAGDVSGFLASLRANFDISYEQVNANTILLSALGGDVN